MPLLEMGWHPARLESALAWPKAKRWAQKLGWHLGKPMVLQWDLCLVPL